MSVCVHVSVVYDCVCVYLRCEEKCVVCVYVCVRVSVVYGAMTVCVYLRCEEKSVACVYVCEVCESSCVCGILGSDCVCLYLRYEKCVVCA